MARYIVMFQKRIKQRIKEPDFSDGGIRRIHDFEEKLNFRINEESSSYNFGKRMEFRNHLLIKDN